MYCYINLCLCLLFSVSVLMVAFNSSMIVTTEGDGDFQVCIDIVNGTIGAGLNVPIIYTLQNEASKNTLKDLDQDIHYKKCFIIYMLTTFTEGLYKLQWLVIALAI